MSKSSQSTSLGLPNIEAGAADPEKAAATGTRPSQDQVWSRRDIWRGDAVRALPEWVSIIYPGKTDFRRIVWG